MWEGLEASLLIIFSLQTVRCLSWDFREHISQPCWEYQYMCSCVFRDGLWDGRDLCNYMWMMFLSFFSGLGLDWVRVGAWTGSGSYPMAHHSRNGDQPRLESLRDSFSYAQGSWPGSASWSRSPSTSWQPCLNQLISLPNPFLSEEQRVLLCYCRLWSPGLVFWG